MKTPLSIIVQAIGAGFHIEEDLQATKALGLDQYEVRSYRGWYRHYSECSLAALGLSPNNVCYSRIVRSAPIPNNIHITLVLLAYAFLVSICLQAPRPLPAPAEDPRAKPSLIALTPCEVRHLLAHLIWPAPTAAPLICQWSIGSREPTNIGLATLIVAAAKKSAKPLCQATGPSPPQENCARLPGRFRGVLLGSYPSLCPAKLPGVGQTSSRSCSTSHTKGVVL